IGRCGERDRAGDGPGEGLEGDGGAGGGLDGDGVRSVRRVADGECAADDARTRLDLQSAGQGERRITEATSTGISDGQRDGNGVTLGAAVIARIGKRDGAAYVPGETLAI